MRHTSLILRNRLRIANHYVENIRDHVYIHLFVFMAVVMFIVFGGTAFFTFLFRYLNNLEDFGALLMDRLIGMVMMAYFSMLVFSNLIITLSTTYISKEIEYYMSKPVSHTSIFFVKLFESMVYSSWAFALLSLPLFISFGIVREVHFLFYVLIPLIVLPFLMVPAAMGAILVMVLTAILPARRALKYSVAFIALAALAVMAIFRFTGASATFSTMNMQNFTNILSILKAGTHAWLPHAWVTRGMLALAEGDYGEFFYWTLVILSTSLMLMQVCAWLAPKLYYRGWCMARDSRGGGKVAGPKNGRGLLPRSPIFTAIEKCLGFMQVQTRSLIMKDLKTFWRDPSQWSQLIILFGLVFLYIAHLRSAYYRNNAFDLLVPKWQVIMSYFNMGATCFILSILTTRFVYPMLSLEGKQFWAVGLAPMKRTKVVWEKYWLSWGASLIITESLMLFSSWILEVPSLMLALSAGTIFFLSLGLTSLSVGLGASTPDFKEDNPARIANGLGGTLNVILSLAYIGTVIAIQLFPSFLLVTGNWPQGTRGWQLGGATIIALAVVQLIVIVVPMRIGLKKWQAIEF
ncbi:MAG: putative ABC transporter permease subunit [Candidatus Sumerlaeia bacterium]